MGVKTIIAEVSAECYIKRSKSEGVNMYLEKFYPEKYQNKVPLNGCGDGSSAVELKQLERKCSSFKGKRV